MFIFTRTHRRTFGTKRRFTLTHGPLHDLLRVLSKYRYAELSTHYNVLRSLTYMSPLTILVSSYSTYIHLTISRK